MLHVSEDTFYADLLQFDQPMPQLRVMQALEQDILVLLRSARMASAGDSTDTLGADAGDLLLAVEMISTNICRSIRPTRLIRTVTTGKPRCGTCSNAAGWTTCAARRASSSTSATIWRTRWATRTAAPAAACWPTGSSVTRPT